MLTLFATLISLAATKAATKPIEVSVAPSKYLEELTRETFPEAPAPAQPPTIALDFAGKHDDRYFFHQELENQNAGSKGLINSYYLGDLFIRSAGDGSHAAYVTFENMRVRNEVTYPGYKPEVTTVKPEMAFIGQLHENGNFDEAADGHEALAALLFPVPSKPLAVGESVDKPVEFDLPVLQTVFTGKGVSHIKCTGYVTHSKRVCARLEQSFDVTATDAATKRTVTSHGQSVAYYAPAEKRFVSSIAVITLYMTNAGKTKPDIRADNFVKILLAQ